MGLRKGFAKHLQGSGFKETANQAGAPFFDLWVVGSKDSIGEDKLRELAKSHFPV